MQGITYSDAGVDIKLGDQASDILYEAARATWANRKGLLGEVISPFDDFSGLRAGIFEHDGTTYYDDNVWLFFDTNHDRQTYYQAIINCNGAVFDRKCSLIDGVLDRDVSWNAGWEVSAGRDADSWTLEMKIAKRELAPFSEDMWGFNMRRLQPRLNDAGYWSIPFAHAPQYFGVLEFK